MIKTQVQIPDELYRKAKKIAREREWSLAEVMRRGLEYMTQSCPPASETPFILPILSAEVFAENSDETDLKAILADDETLRSIAP